MERYCIYTRVSTTKQGESGLGLESQLKICKDYIKSQNGQYVKEFGDIESGKSRTRKGLWEAIDFCKKHDCVLVLAKLDRLARDVEFTFKILNTGVKVYFCDMPVVNTMILGVFASVAQYERELISERTKKALAAKKARGEKWSRNTDTTAASKASAESRRIKAQNNPANRTFWEYMQDYIKYNGEIKDKSHFAIIAQTLNERGKTTASGLPFTPERAMAMYANCLKIYA